MKPSVSPWIYWKIAWRNMYAQKRQTLLTMIGSCIGAALIMASTIFFQSFDESGARWLQRHYGPIEWELQPQQHKPYFNSAAEMTEIEAHLQLTRIKSMKVVSFETKASKVDGNLSPLHSGLRYLAIGVDGTQAAEFDPDNPLWRLSLAEDQIIVSEAVAKPLDLQLGDTVMLPDAGGGAHYFQVKGIAEESGISGYRGSAKAEGTLLVTMSAARKLAGLPEDAHTSYFSRREGVSLQAKPTYFPSPLPLFTVSEQKQSDFKQVDQMKQKYGATFVLCSVTAVIAGTVLMLQVLFMLTDSRRKLLAVLRAIGFQRGQIQRIFLIEAMLIQICSLAAGLLAGIPIGFGIIALFQWLNRELLLAYSGKMIPISPYLALSGVLFAGVIVFSLFAAAALFSSIKLRRLPIVAALREDSQLARRARSVKQRMIRLGLTAVSAVTVALHIGMLASGKATELILSQNPSSNGHGIFVFAVWFLASITSLYVIARLLPVIQKGLKPLLRRIGVQEAAQLLAFRYPAGNVRRTFLIMLLFSCCFMLLTLVIHITRQYDRTVQEKTYTVMGYPGYILYQTDEDKQEIMKRLNQDKELSEVAKQAAVIEPYLLQTTSEGWLADRNQLNFMAPDDAWIQAGKAKLTSRAPQFASDREAWEAVMHDPEYVLVDRKFSYPPEQWPAVFRMSHQMVRGLQVGEKIPLQLFEKPALPNTPDFGKEPQIKETISVTIAGFVESDAGLEFYNQVFVNPGLHDRFKTYGYRWESTPGKGYILLPLASDQAVYLRQVEQQLDRLNITTFHAPSISEAGEDISLIQMLWIFNGFMIMTMGIGLAGLAIVQLRAVQERSKVMAMLRCIGLGSRTVRQMLLIEGTLVGWIGIINGLIFGTIGGYLVHKLIETSKKPTDSLLPFSFPWELLMPVTVCLLLLTLWLNLAPSGRILRLSPGESIRRAEE
ncbi:ABC transporter permease [Paenibacillus hodogayensis]|uniref:ABC transporter permease n=1 Tax=Paenibacillus hodogayensis TaxID=279208 RepID=A0ABV5VY44_9BACL